MSVRHRTEGPISKPRRKKRMGKHRKAHAGAQPTKMKFKKKISKKFKLKTHSGANKRFYQLKSGTFVHKREGKNHLMAGSSRHRQTLKKRRMKRVEHKGTIKRLYVLLPYSRKQRHRPVPYKEIPAKEQEC